MPEENLDDNADQATLIVVRSDLNQSETTPINEHFALVVLPV